MPKFDIIVKPGEPLPDEFAQILNKRLSPSLREKLLKHGGLIRLSVASPYVDRKVAKKTPVVVDASFIAELEADAKDVEIIRTRLQPLAVNQLREICTRLLLPVRSQASSREIREAVVQRIQSEHFWQKISGSSSPSNTEQKRVEPMLYFAYGSNMDWEQMHHRCPKAKFLFKATLPNYTLEFTHQRINNRGGAADVVERPGEVVWGVVYQLEDSDLPGLYGSEGYQPGRSHNSYAPSIVTVFRDGNMDHPVETMAFTVSHKLPPHQKPSHEYLAHILDGAKHWELPVDYQAMFKNFEVQA